MLLFKLVSVFAVGFADHFVAESGGDQSITNSNSNFGSCALRAKGFKSVPFTQDKAGTDNSRYTTTEISKYICCCIWVYICVTQDNKTCNTKSC